ncbi:TetR family transcriptional regulator [Actinosynnema sp. NPDC020468]|uniref:TetR/AcrR family transcriptional regulator n=1 Tax=Actinosynnema sp. NPDC020468 TaxID=3154488 RepID=UPI0033DBCFEE
MTSEPPVRKRDATATKALILDAAAVLFAERGFDRTTVRDIAARAGANQALLFRYFGSKEALFEEVVARGGREQLESTPAAALPAAMIRRLLTGDGQSIAVFLRAAHSDRAAAEVRARLGDDYTRVLATLTDAPDAELRAELVLAWVLGLGLVREVAGAEPLRGADPDEVVRLLAPAVRTLLERAE